MRVSKRYGRSRRVRRGPYRTRTRTSTRKRLTVKRRAPSRKRKLPMVKVPITGQKFNQATRMKTLKPTVYNNAKMIRTLAMQDFGPIQKQYSTFVGQMSIDPGQLDPALPALTDKPMCFQVNDPCCFNVLQEGTTDASVEYNGPELYYYNYAEGAEMLSTGAFDYVQPAMNQQQAKFRPSRDRIYMKHVDLNFEFRYPYIAQGPSGEPLAERMADKDVNIYIIRQKNYYTSKDAQGFGSTVNDVQLPLNLIDFFGTGHRMSQNHLDTRVYQVLAKRRISWRSNQRTNSHIRHCNIRVPINSPMQLYEPALDQQSKSPWHWSMLRLKDRIWCVVVPDTDGHSTDALEWDLNRTCVWRDVNDENSSTTRRDEDNQSNFTTLFNKINEFNKIFKTMKVQESGGSYFYANKPADEVDDTFSNPYSGIGPGGTGISADMEDVRMKRQKLATTNPFCSVPNFFPNPVAMAATSSVQQSINPLDEVLADTAVAGEGSLLSTGGQTLQPSAP